MSIFKADAARVVGLFTSRRFLLSVAGVVAIFSEELFNVKIDPDKITDVTLLVVTLVASLTFKDHKSSIEK